MQISQIWHWTVTYMLAEIPPICRVSKIGHSLQIYWNLHAGNPTPPLTFPCYVTVWEIYSAILLLCRCLYFTQWRTTMNYPTWRHHVNSWKFNKRYHVFKWITTNRTEDKGQERTIWRHCCKKSPIPENHTTDQRCRSLLTKQMWCLSTHT